MWRELVEVFDEVEASRDDRVLVLTGAGDAFTAGAALTPGGTGDNPTGGFGTAVHAMRVVGRTVLRLHLLHVPTIAAVNGVTTGAGCNLALGCDLIVAADTARFSEIFARRGLSLDGGGSWILPRLLGLHRANELAYLTDLISAAESDRARHRHLVITASERHSVLRTL